MRRKVEYRTVSKLNYNRFCEKYPTLSVSYNDFCNIIYSFNYAFRDYLLETGMRAKLPWGFGEFAVTKKKKVKRFVTLPNGKEKVLMPVDWQKSKILKKTVYHLNYDTDGFVFRWKWFGETARLYKTDIWNFRPSRVTKRLLAHYINQPGYVDKYQEWHLAN